jgi:pyridoxamine 5'-phosphate oxidase
VVDAQVQAIDWLELHPEGPRRAIFGAGSARWVQP